MGKSTDVRIQSATAAWQQIAYRTPIKFGGKVVTSATLLDVTVTVEDRQGRVATGFGSMPLGNVWAWPTAKLTPEQTLAAMQACGTAALTVAEQLGEFGHPLDLTQAIEHATTPRAAAVCAALELGESMPMLAQLVATSPLEAAVHDAYGRLLGQSAFAVLGREYANHDLSAYLGSDFAGEYLDQYVSPTPQPRLPLYHLVGALDPLSPADVRERPADSLPVTLGEWIAADELTHLKIKLNGDDLKWDVERVLAIEAVTATAQHARGCSAWYYSLDFNEKCASVDYVLAFLAQLQEGSSAAFARVQYIEQPTHRNLRAHPENRMHAAAKIKPVVIDESLIDLETLLLAREQGYSGVALKACKGQTGALLMGAAAQKYKLFLCVQDLTCPGASFLHSASLAAHIPTVAAIEGNGRQYCPAGNRGWQDRYPTLYKPRQGQIETALLAGVGLGFDPL